MKILGIDSSADTVAVSLLENEAVLASFCGNIKKTHSNTLLPTIEYLLSYAGVRPDDIDLYAISVGPGSFTGIRIGVAAAKGLMWGAEKPGAGVSTLEAMAWNGEYAGDGTVICCAMDARRNQVYNAIFTFVIRKTDIFKFNNFIHII